MKYKVKVTSEADIEVEVGEYAKGGDVLQIAVDKVREDPEVRRQLIDNAEPTIVSVSASDK